MIKPVVVGTVLIDSLLYAFREFELVVGIDYLFCTLDNPRENGIACIVIKMIGKVLNIARALDFCVKGNNDESSPNAVVRSGYSREVVCVKNEGVAGGEAEGVLVFLFSDSSSQPRCKKALVLMTPP